MISDLGFGIRAVAVALVVTTVSISAQPQVRRATNIAALLAYPTFYTGRPMKRWFRRGRQVPVGDLVVDTIDGEIVFVEVLGRSDVRSALH